MNAKELTDKIVSLDYPHTQHYDAQTLEPMNDITRRRVDHLNINAPELFNGGESLLDIGTCKGYLPHLLTDRYKSIVGYEPNAEYCDLCNAVKSCRCAENVRFINGSFIDIPLGRPTGEYAAQKFDVVFVGNVHHYFFMKCYESDVPWLWVKKLVALTRKYLIIDGPFEMDDRAAVTVIADRQNWDDKTRESYTFAELNDQLKPQFRLVRGPVTNEGGIRQTAVWERCCDDMEHREIDFEEIKRSGIQCKCNRLRPSGSVVKVENLRYKYNPDCQSDEVFMILNALPQYFPHRHFIFDIDGIRSGDCCDWIYGKNPKTHIEILNNFLRMNAALQSVGLCDLQLRLDDYIYSGDKLYSIDNDMLGPFCEIKTHATGDYNTPYLEFWKNSVIKSISEQIDQITKIVESPDVFSFNDLV